MPTCRAGAQTSGRRLAARGASGRTAGRVSATLMAALMGALMATMCPGASVAADQPLTPVPPEPSASAFRHDISVLGSYLVGRYAHGRGDYLVAAAHLQRVLAEDPDNPSLLRRTVSLLVAAGRVEDAAVLGRRLLEINDRARLARFVVGLHDARAGDFEGALQHIEKIPREGIYAILLPLAEGWLHTGAGSEAAALAALAPLADREPFRRFFLLHAGLMHDLADRQEEAEALLREAVALSSGSLRPTAALGSLLARAGRIDEARAVYEQFSAQSPNNFWAERALAAIEAGEAPPPLVANAREGLAETLFGTASAIPWGENDDAGLVYARLALFLRNDLDAARYLIADILEEADLLEDAVAVYRAIPAESDFAWSARLRAASDIAELGRVDEAVAALSAMADERPERFDAVTALGDAYRVSERYEDAAAAYGTAVERIPVIEARHWRLFYVRGIAFERLGAWPRAEADFLRALELEPDQPLVLNYLGYTWVEQRHKLDEARTMIEKAVALRPDDGYIVDSLGWAAYRLGDFEEAVLQLERAVELVASDPVINDHLGDAYWQVGRLHEARFQWRRVLTLEPEDELADLVRRKLADGLSAEAEADDGD